MTLSPNKLKSVYKHVYSRAYIKLHEHTYGTKGKFLFVDNKSDTLLIVFSAFTGEVPRYNYFYSFKELHNISQLYILDNYGKRGSYYLYENGSSFPENDVKVLVESIIKKYSIKTIITAGTSKGGTAAIYFGLKLHADHIFSGACQYYIGTYLDREEHKEILEAMRGQYDLKTFVSILNDKMSEVIKEYKDTHGSIHLLYSKNELTYERQTVHLIDELRRNDYCIDEKIETFTDHSIVGNYFVPYITHWLVEYTRI